MRKELFQQTLDDANIKSWIRDAEAFLEDLKMLEAKGLLWEASKKGRKAFRNRFPYWVAENIGKIRPNAPYGAIDEVVDRLKRSVIGG